MGYQISDEFRLLQAELETTLRGRPELAGMRSEALNPSSPWESFGFRVWPENVRLPDPILRGDFPFFKDDAFYIGQGP
jgi:hypothetical protein